MNKEVLRTTHKGLIAEAISLIESSIEKPRERRFVAWETFSHFTNKRDASKKEKGQTKEPTKKAREKK